MTQLTEEQIALARSNRLLEENERNLAYNLGKIDAIIDGMASDREHIELLRHLAWARTGMKFGLNNGKVTGAPPGWPSDGDESSMIKQWVADQKGKYRSENKTIFENELYDTETVREFRNKITG